LSLCFIFHLRFKSRTLHQLQNFNSLWAVRFILVSFITFWALNELLRLSFFRHHVLLSLFTSPTLSNQANLCKIQAVLSLGFFEPAFLVTLLFLVNVSIKKKTPNGILVDVIPFVIITCFPVLIFQIIFVFFAPSSETQLPVFFTRSYVVLSKNGLDDADDNKLLCAYPLLNTIVFGAFGIGYSLCFFFSSWKAVSLVINKGLRVRIYRLAFTVLISLPVQILCLGLSVLWEPEEPAYGGMALVVFISAFLCAVVGEGILVISPITDTLAAGGECCQWVPGDRSRRREEGQSPVGYGLV
jgi:hypothetical protein